MGTTRPSHAGLRPGGASGPSTGTATAPSSAPPPPLPPPRPQPPRLALQSGMPVPQPALLAVAAQLVLLDLRAHNETNRTSAIRWRHLSAFIKITLGFRRSRISCNFCFVAVPLLDSRWRYPFSNI